MNEDLEAQVRRLWGGEVASSRPEPDDLPSELVRTVSAASTIAEDQVDRLDTLSLPLLRLNTFQERSSPIPAAARFLDQIRSDYRRVSPRIALSTLEQFRRTDAGQEILHEAHVDNQSVGVLVVGELLDSLQPVNTLRQWTEFGQAAAAEKTDFASTFGNVLGPIVEFALTYRSPTPAWAADLESDAGYKWVETFIRAGAAALQYAESQDPANAQEMGQLIIATPDQIRQVDSHMAEKVKTFNWDAAMDETLRLQPNAFANDPPRSNSTLESRIIQNWEAIATSLNLPPTHRERSRVSLTFNQIERFRSLFEDEIQIVRAARNNVAHTVPIDEDALRAAVDISERLVEILNNLPPD